MQPLSVRTVAPSGAQPEFLPVSGALRRLLARISRPDFDGDVVTRLRDLVSAAEHKAPARRVAVKVHVLEPQLSVGAPALCLRLGALLRAPHGRLDDSTSLRR